MSVATIEPRPLTPAGGSAARAEGGSGWLVGPWFDLFCVANVAWPLLLLIPWDAGLGHRDSLLFWQVYFVTTPHRWITLVLVFTDRARFRERRGTFLGFAALATAVCVGVRATTGTLTCLLAVDYLWNAWHFAAQHHGVYRIYGRLGGVPPSRGLLVEKWGLRLFLLYITLRIAGTTWAQPQWEAALQQIDWFVPIIPFGLLAADLLRRPAASPGRLAYLASLSTLYLALLWAVHSGRPALVLTLATASALFHAIEYLAIVGWSVRRRYVQMGDEMGWLAWLVPRWAVALGLYLIVLGSAGWWMDQEFLETWLLLNVIVAFLHYAYDGLIWRSPRSRKTSPSSLEGRA